MKKTENKESIKLLTNIINMISKQISSESPTMHLISMF